MKDNKIKKEESKNNSLIDHNENSRDSVHGYMEMGNDALIHGKARALRNNNNRTDDIE